MSSLHKPFGRFNIFKGDDTKITLKEEKNLEGHTGDIFSALHFGPPQNKIVTCSDDTTVRIWSSETSKCLQIIKDHEKWIVDLIKWNEETFMSCAGDDTIKCFSISTFKKIKEFNLNAPVLEVLKLNKDLILCRGSYPTKLFILSYSETKILKKYYVGNLIFSNIHRLLLSRNYENCFYVATNDQEETIRLVNFEKDLVLKEFKSHSKNEMIRSLCLFYTQKNEEILLAFSTSQIIYFYNTSHSKFFKNMEIHLIKHWYNNKKYSLPDDRINSTCCFQNKYLVCGDGSGMVHIYDLLGGRSSIKKMKQQRIHNDYVNNVYLFSQKSISEFQIISCSEDKTIKVTRITNLSMESEDFEERINFLMSQMEDYLFCKEKMKLVVVKMKLRNLVIYGFRALM